MRWLVYEIRAEAAVTWARRLAATPASTEADIERALSAAVRFYELARAGEPAEPARIDAKLAWLKRVLSKPVDLSRM